MSSDCRLTADAVLYVYTWPWLVSPFYPHKWARIPSGMSSGPILGQGLFHPHGDFTLKMHFGNYPLCSRPPYLVVMSSSSSLNCNFVHPSMQIYTARPYFGRSLFLMSTSGSTGGLNGAYRLLNTSHVVTTLTRPMWKQLSLCARYAAISATGVHALSCKRAALWALWSQARRRFCIGIPTWSVRKWSTSNLPPLLRVLRPE